MNISILIIDFLFKLNYLLNLSIYFSNTYFSQFSASDYVKISLFNKKVIKRAEAFHLQGEQGYELSTTQVEPPRTTSLINGIPFLSAQGVSVSSSDPKHKDVVLTSGSFINLVLFDYQ